MSDDLNGTQTAIGWVPITAPHLRECPQCGQPQVVPAMPQATRAVCLRCETVLRHTHRGLLVVPLALNLAALMLFAISAQSALISVSRAGQARVAYLLSGAVGLNASGMWQLAALVVFTTFAAPLCKLLGTTAVLVLLQRPQPPPAVRTLFAWVERLRPWSMIEVYLLSALIAFVRLGTMVQIVFGPALYSLAALMVMMIAADLTLDPNDVWEAMEQRVPLGRPDRRGGGGLPQQRLGCDTCGFVVRRAPGAPCPRCGFALRERKPDSIGRTWALVIAALTLYVPANAYPVLTINELGVGYPTTIFGGIRDLLNAGMWPLAAVVFFASIVVPLLKMTGLATLLISTQFGYRRHLRDRTRLYRIIESIGRWSMIDIFVGSLLVALLQFGSVVSVLPGPGAIAFASVVVLTMLAARTFDPRLMWDAAGMQLDDFE